MASNPNVGPDPVEAKTNHVREKTFVEPKTPEAYKDAVDALPEKTAESKVREEMPAAVDAIKKRV